MPVPTGSPIDWQAPMERLAGNWFTEVRRKKLAGAGRRSG